VLALAVAGCQETELFFTAYYSFPRRLLSRFDQWFSLLKGIPYDPAVRYSNIQDATHNGEFPVNSCDGAGSFLRLALLFCVLRISSDDDWCLEAKGPIPLQVTVSYCS